VKRIEFSAKVKLAAWERSGGQCECGNCAGAKIVPGDGPEYDHRVEAALGGDGSLENCIVSSARCHRSKTSARAPVIAKARRLEKKQANLRPARKALIPGSKGTRYRKKLDGSVERR
jgi:5-methylcytosine-specific restriction endonuclease McrA